MKTAVHSLRFTAHVSRITLLPCCLPSATSLSACAMPGDAAPVVKIGLIAPFEGGVGRWATPSCPRSRRPWPRRTPGRQARPLSGDGSGVQRRPASAHRGQRRQRRWRWIRSVLAVVGPWYGGDGCGCGAHPGRSRSAGRVISAGVRSTLPPREKWGDAALAHAATLARRQCPPRLDALGADIRAHGRPTTGWVWRLR